MEELEQKLQSYAMYNSSFEEAKKTIDMLKAELG